MKLITIKLTNFGGIKSFEFSPEGRSAAVYGDNGTGKTTLADAHFWLLFGRDSAGSAGFSPKPRDEDGEELHNTDTEVEGCYELEDGARVTLRKVLSENWKKKRGSAETVFSGHTVEYFIDGVPKKEKDYNDFLAGIAELQTLMLLSSPMYFSDILDMKKRRELLMSLEKDIHEFDVINSCEELAPLRHLMLKPGATANWYDMEEFVQISKAAAKRANADLAEIPGRIDEQRRNLTEVSEERLAEVRAEIGRLNAKKIALQMEMNATDGEMMQSLRADISGLRAKLEEKRAEFIRRQNEANEGRDEELDGLVERLYGQREEVSKLREKRAEQMRKLERLRGERAELLQQWNEVNAAVWNGETVCPTCGQAIPEEKLETARTEFNLCKSQKLSELNERGRKECSREIIQAAEAEVEMTGSKLISAEAAVKKAAAEMQKLREELKNAERFEDTEAYGETVRDIETAQAQLEALEQCKFQKSGEKKKEIEECEDRVSQLNVEIARYEAGQAARKRIEELEKLEKIAGEAYARARQGLDLAELFGRKKAEMLTEKINGHFKNVRFRLFRVQINEGIKTDCEVLALTANGYIPHSTANNAARINAGLEIIRGFGRHFGVTMPVFVDNAESVTKLDTEGLQVVRLVVSEQDKGLSIHNS